MLKRKILITCGLGFLILSGFETTAIAQDAPRTEAVGQSDDAESEAEGAEPVAGSEAASTEDPADAATSDSQDLSGSEASETSSDAHSDSENADSESADSESAEPAAPAAPAPFRFGGYVEASYQWNFREPQNGINNFLAFANRHNTFTLSNVALRGEWDWEGLFGRVTLQVGQTPDTYYAAEPTLPGASGASPTSLATWRFIQEAYAGYRIQVGGGLDVSAGLFLSPIGPESMQVYNNWNWSRSNLFFGLPFYHTGVRLNYHLSDTWSVSLSGYNGWNSVVDGNAEKSVSAQLYFEEGNTAFSLLYFGGVERPTGSPEGANWRSLFDSYFRFAPMEWLQVMFHVNGGFEPNTFGTHSWIAGAVYARARLTEGFFLSARGDAFHEGSPSNASGVSGRIFWPALWVSSGTLTFEYRALEHILFRIEYRHDESESPMYFSGAVMGDGVTTPFVANTTSQDSIILGTTAWF